VKGARGGKDVDPRLKCISGLKVVQGEVQKEELCAIGHYEVVSN
jgi:hypothetical protein